MELLLAAALAAAVAAAPMAYAVRVITREADKNRATAQARAVAHQTYITELQNRVLAHSWTDFAQLQNDVAGHTQQTVNALNGFGEARSEEAFGESESDVVDQYLRDQGIDLEGPTIG